ncbi:MAG TPA: LacI family DNA-binding transcriptional regulator [Clostridiales bacterium]|nr:LacI family DNA-binding transcriptional regulator [Clostridiales bacterium]HPV01605.1 LacI family DNA-binding transcriptional regulator [Clostridiales bacterium]
MSTIKDVAKRAGVSVATVSRVINGSSRVSPATAKKVRTAVAELNYRPNLLGRNLRKTRSERVLVLIPNIANPFYAEIVKGVEDVASQHGYSIMLCNTDSDPEREKRYVKMLKSRLADGAILMASEMTGEELTELSLEIPIVQCCEYKAGLPITHVSINNEMAAYKAVKHLIGLGHKKIAFIGARNQFLSSLRRKEGYLRALEEAGIDFDPACCAYGDYSYESGFRIMKQLLKLDPRPTAVFCVSDMMAIGAIRSAMEENLLVPEDLAVCGFDNIHFSSMFKPAITTVSQPMYDLGCMAMEALINIIEGKKEGTAEYFLEHELIIRESTVKQDSVC